MRIGRAGSRRDALQELFNQSGGKPRKRAVELYAEKDAKYLEEHQDEIKMRREAAKAYIASLGPNLPADTK